MKLAKRLALLTTAAGLILSLGACGASGSGDAGKDSGKDSGGDSGKTYTWRLGTIYNDPAAKPEYNSFGVAVDSFCKLISEKTNGRVVVEPYYSSVLGASSELWGALRDNEIQVFYGQPMSTADARFGAWSIPYLFSDYDQVAQLIASPDAPLFTMAQEWMEEDGVHLAAVGTSVFRGFFNIKHEVANVADLRDLKCRTYEDKMVQTFWGGICNATSMAFSEVYTGMQTSAVDGLEFAATSVLSSKYYEIANPSYYSDINWQWTSGCNLVISGDAWDELPDELKDIVTQCAWDAQDTFRQEEETNGTSALDTLTKNGTVIHKLTDAERQGWIDYARGLDDKMKDIVGDETWTAIWDVVNKANG